MNQFDGKESAIIKERTMTLSPAAGFGFSLHDRFCTGILKFFSIIPIYIITEEIVETHQPIKGGKER